MYEEVKQNLIEHFLKPFYLWSCCSNKNSIFSDIQKRCPFKTDIINDNIIHMNLGNDIIISFNFKWEEHQTNKFINYRLINIS